jgi:hypothetical protein
MKRRVSKSIVAIGFALALSLSTPSLFAAQRAGIGDPDFGTRIVRIVKALLGKFTFVSNSDGLAPPKP